MLVLGSLGILNSLRTSPGRQAFRHLLRKPLALSSGIVLLFFIGIATLDCIHLSPEVGDSGVSGMTSSVLDKIMSPLDKMYEKTYSAPLALSLFSTETKVVEGRVIQYYPRLTYPPANLKTPEDKRALIATIVWKSFGISLIVIGLIGVFSFVRGFQLNKSFLWGSVTLFLCLFFLLASYGVSRYFHLFGTGKIGQDIFYYTIKSIRTGLIIGTLTTLFMMPLALILGIAAGYFGGFVDDMIQYLYTTLSSIPGVLLITASVLSMQTFIANHPEQFPTLDKSADARLLALCLILGVTSWTSLCRLLRAEALKLREIDFVLAARALGSSSWRIIQKHLLPNVMSIVLITLVLDFSFLVLAEAVLSYVGVGVSPMTISWGNMINGARLELARDPLVWWPMLAAFVFMFVLVLASNLFADAIRDSFDPHKSEH
jgi:peptide/nickel transport system permease protein